MKIASHIISWVFMPLLMPIYALLLVMFVPSNQDYYFNQDSLYLMAISNKLALLKIFLIFSVVAPGVSFLLLYYSKNISSLQMETTKERAVPIIIMLIYCLMLYMFILYNIKVNHAAIPKYFYTLPLSGVFVTLIYFFLNRREKVSIHAGAAGILTGFILAFILQHVEYELWMLMAAIIVSGLVMTARLFLEKHTMREIIIGWSTGVVVTFGLNYF